MINTPLFALRGDYSIGDAAQVAGVCVQAVAILFAAIGISMELRKYRLDKQAALQNQQIDIYQKLEIESTRLFDFEVDHRTVLTPFKRCLPDGGVLKAGEAADRQFIAKRYYEHILNLFEVATRLRRANIVPPEVYASWVAWLFDTLAEWGFRAVWAGLRDNYTSDLRDVFDPFVTRLIDAWDKPFADSAFAGPAPADVEKLRADFYQHVGDLLDCPAIRGWLADNARDQLPSSPFAFG